MAGFLPPPITLLTVIHMSFHPSTQLGSVDPVLFLSIYLLVYPACAEASGNTSIHTPPLVRQVCPQPPPLIALSVGTFC